MKPKNFPGRKRQRRIEALERQREHLLVLSQGMDLTVGEGARIADELENVENQLEKVL